jgi:hypothetical protein
MAAPNNTNALAPKEKGFEVDNFYSGIDIFTWYVVREFLYVVRGFRYVVRIFYLEQSTSWGITYVCRL